MSGGSSLNGGDAGEPPARSPYPARNATLGPDSGAANKPLRLAIAGAVALTAVGGVLALLAVRANGPVRVAIPHPTAEAATACKQLTKQLPETLAGRSRRPTTPASDFVRAWGDPALVLFCGVGRPAGLTPTAELTTVNEVDWLPVEDEREWRFTTVGRIAYVEVLAPKSDGAPTDPLVELAELIKDADPLTAGRSAGAVRAG